MPLYRRLLRQRQITLPRCARLRMCNSGALSHLKKEQPMFHEIVIAGLDPVIHAACSSTWTTGSSPVVTKE